jgi:hypothetical protein
MKNPTGLQLRKASVNTRLLQARRAKLIIVYAEKKPCLFVRLCVCNAFLSRASSTDFRLFGLKN